MDSSLLYDCKSEIVQLVQRSSLLLISTVLKPVLLDLKTNQITQVRICSDPFHVVVYLV